MSRPCLSNTIPAPGLTGDACDGWKQLVREGKEMEAVMLVRRLHGYSLRESKAVVDGFREKINSQ